MDRPIVHADSNVLDYGDNPGPFYIRSHTENWFEGNSKGPYDVRGRVRVGGTSRSPGRYTEWVDCLQCHPRPVRPNPELVLSRNRTTRRVDGEREEVSPVHKGDAHRVVLQRQAESLSFGKQEDLPVQERPIAYNEPDAFDARAWYKDLAAMYDWEEKGHSNDLTKQASGGSYQ